MHFLNVQHTVETLGRLVRASGDALPGPADLDNAYRRIVASMRPFAPPQAGVSVSFEGDTWGCYLQENKIFENIFASLETTGQRSQALWVSLTGQALSYIRTAFPAIGYLCDLLITDIVLLTSKSTGGGSASHLPGLVAISPGEAWTVMDFAETLVHEMTHLNLFVLDMAYGLYELSTSELEQDQHRVVSAVKIGELRPFDKAFHSAVVAVPLMYMQNKRGETALVDDFATSLADCCKGLEGKRDRFTPYGQTLLDELTEFARTLDMGLVSNGLTRNDVAA